MTHAVVRLCATCAPQTASDARAALQDALDAAGLPATVMAQACFNACAAPVSLSLQAQGFATYFFAGVDPMAHRDDIVATVELYLSSPQGWIEDARPCGQLRLCLSGRVPALAEIP